MVKENFSISKLKGVWVYNDNFTEEEIAELFPDLGFTPDECAYAPKAGLYLVRNTEFLDSTYRVNYDITETRTCFFKYIDNFTKVLYDNCESIYDFDLEEGKVMFEDLADFRDFLAFCYDSEATYEDLLDMLWYDFMDLYVGLDGEALDEGTYYIDGNKVYMTAEGEKEATFVVVTMTSDTSITMEYSNNAIELTKRS